MASNFSGSSTNTCTPIFILAFCKLKSKKAILAPVTFLVITEKKRAKIRIKKMELENNVRHGYKLH